MKKSLVASLLMAIVGIGSAHAGIVGDTVNVTHYYPDSSSAYADLGSQVVPTAAFTFDTVYNVFVYSDFLTFTAFCGTDCTWTNASFNGPVITDLTSSLFSSVSIDASSTYTGFDASRLSFDSNHIYMNFQGLSANGFLRVDFTNNSVPEPGTMALAGFALAGLGLSRRRKG